jgi:hypothetical protein
MHKGDNKDDEDDDDDDDDDNNNNNFKEKCYTMYYSFWLSSLS